MFWFFSILLIFATAAAVCWPLLSERVDNSSAADGNVEVYKDQLEEVDADLDRGILTQAEAEAARAEISRRLLAAAAGAEPSAQTREANQPSWKIWVPIAAAIPLIAVPLYLSQGQPDLDAAPYAQRIEKPGKGDGQINSLIAQVEAKLREDPQDGRGWDVIAPVYFARQQYRKSANAFAQAIQINGPSKSRLMGLGESIVFTNDELVTEPARLAFEQVVKLDPRAIKARFWLALAKEQDGKTEDAIAAYRQLLSEGSTEDNWYTMLASRVMTLQRQAGQAPAPNAPALGPRITSKAPEIKQPGPTREQVRDAQSMAPADRTAMINTMVEGLAEKLGDDSTDSAGWLRLIRSYAVLGRRDDAATALTKARTIFKDNAAVKTQLTELASRLKLQ